MLLNASTLLTPVVNNSDFWLAIRSAMQLEHHLSEKRVQQEIRWLQAHPEYWERLGPRMQRYLPYLFAQVRARGLPAELAFLPVVESALDPYAFSPYGASGLWQFMRPTAKQYGLRMTEYYDGRRDVIDATEAALNFLQDLHGRFDDWQLALAAYNAGGGTVSKALRRSQHRDFFRLRLPRETRAYVPRLLAISAVIAQPEAYGITLPPVRNVDPLRVINLSSAYDVAVVAETLGIGAADIYGFNPGLKRSQWSRDTPLRLTLPVSYQGALQDASHLLASVPLEQRVAWREIVVKAGDTISELAAANDLSSRQLRVFNHLDNDFLRVGQSLRIPSTSTVTLPNVANTSSYTVRRGDSLWSIARRGKTSIDTLARLNRIGRRDLLRVGQTIRLPLPNALPTQLSDAPSKIRRIQYKVRRGDSLSRIAKKFRVRVEDIVQWNEISPQRYLQPGQALTLFVDVVGG
jgi:membrane-bound lytic murein transglycosylase D